jgi:hypothetical protein
MKHVEIFYCCPRCQLEGVLWVPLEGLRNWDKGMLIQNAMPELTSDEREKLMTGYCGPCWDRMFNEED